MKVAITKLSSKGQIVIPTSLRKGMQEGDQFMVIQEGDRLILKKITKKDKALLEDLEFARRTEEAYQEYLAGNFIEQDVEDFLEDLKTW